MFLAFINNYFYLHQEFLNYFLFSPRLNFISIFMRFLLGFHVKHNGLECNSMYRYTSTELQVVGYTKADFLTCA